MRKVLSAIMILTVLAGLQACTSSSIDTVKDGTLALDSSRTVGQVFDSYNYFSVTSWKSFKDNKGREVVEFTGTVDYDKYVGAIYGGVTLSPEIVTKAKKNMENMEMSFLAQFAVKGNRFLLIYSGINVGGVDENGKLNQKKIPDTRMETIEAVYRNVPLELVSVMLLNFCNK